MARGIGEDPKRSPGWHLAQLEYPATREDLVQTAEDNEAPPEVINFFKALPKQRYATSATVKKSKMPTKTSEVPKTSRVIPDESFRCMKISATSALFRQAMASAMNNAQAPRCCLPVR